MARCGRIDVMYRNLVLMFQKHGIDVHAHRAVLCPHTDAL
jgi:hypothetical protein